MLHYVDMTINFDSVLIGVWNMELSQVTGILVEYNMSAFV